MMSEAIPVSAEDSEKEVIGAGSPEKRNIGPLSDLYEGPSGPEFYATEGAQKILDRLNTPRNPDEEVKVSEERESVGEQLKQVNKLIEKEKEREGELGSVRQSLGTSHGKGSKLKELEEAKEKLEEDARHIELASTYNDTLESFSDLSSEEREHIAKTGKTGEGEHLRDKHGNKIDSSLAKELAHLYQKGGRRMTWGATRRLGQVADQILKDVKGAIKGIFGLDKKEKPSTS